MVWDAKAIILVAFTLLNTVIVVTMKFNDMKHMGKDLEELKTNFNHWIKKQYNLAQRVSRLEGKTEK